MKPRVLHLLGNLYMTGGSERQAAQLAQNLHENSKCDVLVACLDPSGNWGEELVRIGINKVPSFKFHSFFSLAFFGKLLKFVIYLRREKVDIVHTHDFYTNVFGMAGAWLARVPVRVASKRETEGLRTAAQSFVEYQAFRLANRIVVNAEAVRRHLIDDGVRAEKIVKVFNGLDLERLSTSRGRSEALGLVGLPVEGANRYVTIVANMLFQVKDHPTFLRAARIVRQAVPDARFVLAGEGPLKEDLRALAVELGLADDVFMTGACKHMAELLSVSEVCVLSSRAEGFSNAILEYMGAGRPVVATRVGGAAEAIIEGVTGYMVESGDYETMAARIIELLEDPARAAEMGRTGREVVMGKFSCESQLGITERLYDQLLASTKFMGKTNRIEAEIE